MSRRRTEQRARGLAPGAVVGAVLLVASAAPYAAGCSGDTGEASTPPWTPSGTVAPATPTTPRRTIEDRNPLGNTDAAANLMVDGDFELTGRQGQMPWAVFGTNSQETLNYETGGRCRSGVRCGALGAGQQIIGWMASPPSGSIRVSFWAHPSTGLCRDFAARVLDIDNGTGGTPIYATEDRADASGWCRFTGVAPNLRSKAPVLYGTVGSKAGIVLLDDAVAEPATDESAQAMHLRNLAPFTASEAARFRAAITWLREHRRYGRPPARGVGEAPPRRPLDR